MQFLRTPEHKRLIKMLATARNNKGLTQQQLAEQIDEPQNFISKYESGERRLNFLEVDFNPKLRRGGKQK